MRVVNQLILVTILLTNSSISYTHYLIKKENNNQLLPFNAEENLELAIADIMESFPTQYIAIAYDNHTDLDVIEKVIFKFSNILIAFALFNITLENQRDKYFKYLGEKYNKYENLATIFFCNHRFSEHMLSEITYYDYIRKNLYYIFYWGKPKINGGFLREILEAMKIVVIINTRPNAILYNQVINNRTNSRFQPLEMVNWWTLNNKLSKYPTLPSTYDTYRNFHERNLIVPVLNKPPWHFINYKETYLPPCSSYDVLYENGKNERSYKINSSDEEADGGNLSMVEGGRDHKLLNILKNNLNFRVKYCDPPQRSQGVTFSENGTFDGALGLIWKREADLFVGDVALTADRFKVADFSFITLADSGAFITHAPSRLNEALALVRPFHWKVWPVIFLTLILSGPVLFFLVLLPNSWRATLSIPSKTKLFFDCYWYSTSLFLKQSIKLPYDSNRIRFFTIIVTISATYIIADVYSANLTSLLAKPGREIAINNLYELEEAMLTKYYKLYVEKHSSSYNLLENGTGVYNRLWRLMNQQQLFTVDSVEKGVIAVKESYNVVLLGGRETLFFDIQRFGANNFHLSQKLNTAYSAIAFQVGCPYVENFNSILIALFEGGILTKITENEYEKLGKKRSAVSEGTVEAVAPVGKTEARSAAKAVEENEKTQPISLKMLQGAFYLLLFGCAFSTFTLIMEILIYRINLKSMDKNNYRKITIIRNKLRKLKKSISAKTRKICNFFLMTYRNLINDPVIETFPYLE